MMSMPQRPEPAASGYPIRILLVDDEAIVRYGLSSILEIEPTVEVVGEADNGEAAITKTAELQPDVVLMDLNMPVMDGVSAIPGIHAAYPQAKILVLTVYTEDHYLIEAMQQGASGYLLKNTPPEDLVALIQATYKGYVQIDPSMGKKLSQRLQPKASSMQSLASERSSLLAASLLAISSPAAVPSGAGQSEGKPLIKQNMTKQIMIKNRGITPREQEVLQLVAEGASNREIASVLQISEKTVKNHVSNLLRRVGLRDRTQLAIWANSQQENR